MPQEQQSEKGPHAEVHLVAQGKGARVTGAWRCRGGVIGGEAGEAMGGCAKTMCQS